MRALKYLNWALLVCIAFCILLLLVVRIDVNLGLCRLTCTGIKRPLAILLALYAARWSYLLLFRKELPRRPLYYLRRDIPVIIALFSLLSFFTLTKKQIVSAITPTDEQCRYLTGDEPSYMLMCQSVVLDRDVNLWNDSMERKGGVTFGCPRAGPHKAYMNRDEKRIFSIHYTGLPILLAPVFALAVESGLAPRFVCAAFLSILTTVGMLMIYHLTRASGAAAIMRGALTMILTVTCPVMFYSHQIYPETAGMLLVLLCFLLMSRERPGTASRRRAFMVAAVTGAAAAYLPWLHMRYAIFSVCILAAFAVYHRHEPLSVAVAFFPAALSAILVMYFHWIWYGSPMPNAPYVVQGWSSTLEVSPLRAAKCLTGVLVDSGSGLLAWSPYLTFVPAGIVFCMRRDRALTLALLVPTALYFVVVGSWHHWWGGFCPPGRLLVPIMPMLALWTAGFLGGNRRKSLTVLFGVLAALSVFYAMRAAYGDFTSLYQKRHILETYPLLGSDQFVRSFTPRIFHGENRPFVYGAAYLLVAGLLNLYALVRTPAGQSGSEA